MSTAREAERPFWREWDALDWAAAVFMVVLGFALEAVLPDWVWLLLQGAAVVLFVVLVRRRHRRRPLRG